MPKSNKNFNNDLYGFLQAQNFGRIETKNVKGDDVPKPDMADQFIFHYKSQDKDYGSVVITTHGGVVKVFYNKSAFSGDRDWSKFLMKLKDFSLRHGQMKFKPEDLDKIGDEMTRRHQEQKEEKLLEGYYGTKHTSYSDSTPSSIKMIIKHSKPLEETDARFRFVEKIFLETDRGERLLLNTKKPSIGRVYARHLAEGGEYNDERWKHINEIAEDISKLGGFIRATRLRQFNESVGQLVTEAHNYYQTLRETIRKLQGSKGYQQYFESWKPTLLEQNEDADFSNMFMSSSIDPRIEAALPVLNKLNFSLKEVTEANEFETWANEIVEAISPVQQQKIDKLVKLLQSPTLAVGPDANIIHALSDYIDNDDDLEELQDELFKVANKDPDHDAKPVIISWLQQHSDNDFYEKVLDKVESSSPAAPEPPPAVAPKPVAPQPVKPETQPIGGETGEPSAEILAKADSLMNIKEDELEERKTSKPAQRNFVAKHAQKTGAGAHGKQGYQRHEKHKKKLGEDDSQELSFLKRLQELSGL